MDIGITGLGRMGAGMAERWLRGGHRVVAHNRSRGPVDELAAKGADPAYSIEQLVLNSRRRVRSGSCCRPAM